MAYGGSWKSSTGLTYWPVGEAHGRWTTHIPEVSQAIAGFPGRALLVVGWDRLSPGRFIGRGVESMTAADVLLLTSPREDAEQAVP